jgi:hypothetical protein
MSAAEHRASVSGELARDMAERWHRGNEEYLAAALAWLRLRLERQAASLGNPMPVRMDQNRAESVPDDRPGSERELDQAAEAMRLAEDHEPPPAMALLSRRLGLSSFERNILLLTVAVELDTRMPALCARAQGDGQRPWPTFALCLAMFEDAAWEALSPERPLRYWRLLEIAQSGQPLITSALRADERIVNYLKGLNHLDERLTPLLLPGGGANEALEAHGHALPPSQQEAVDAVLRHLRAGTPGPRPPVIQLLGSDASCKELVAARAAAEVGLELVRMPAALLPGDTRELDAMIRLWQRESLLLPLALFLDVADLEGPTSSAPARALGRFLAHSRALVFLACRDLRPDTEHTTLVLDVARPTPIEQQTLWRAALDGAAPDSPSVLAGQFHLNAGAIHRITRAALADGDARDDARLHQRLWDGCLMETRPQLDILAQRIDVKATWADIVLPSEQTALLRQLVAQVRQRARVYDDWGFRRRMNRGMGTTALFSGESGTGKTMAAEVLANELRLHLYRIDLSAVVSKYIGETEKNLRRLFDAAEDGGALLFFDEADALFGKRSEVKDSHDRYANIEINYLLQRMEAYRGLAVLATNLKSALDAAFVRRLRFIVEFPFPGQAERRVIWQRAFPAEVPLGALDWEHLARFQLTGGSIHNIALHAAFRAADQGVDVSMPIVLEATRTELRKMERPIHEAEFRRQEARR